MPYRFYTLTLPILCFIYRFYALTNDFNTAFIPFLTDFITDSMTDFIPILLPILFSPLYLNLEYRFYPNPPAGENPAGTIHFDP